MDAERKLKKAKIDVMRAKIPSLRLWSGVMALGKTSLCDKTPTAYTNGRDEVYGRAFVERMPTKQLSSVVLHEAMHKGLRHLTVWRKLFEEDRNLANRACDYVVNRMIVKADPHETVVQFPRNPDGSLMWLYDERFDGMSARQVFDILKQEDEQGGGGNGSDSFDEHGWDDIQSLDKDERDALEKEIDHALRRGEAEAKKCGAGRGDIPSEVGDLLRPKIDWRKALQEFVVQLCAGHDDTSYRRLNRRFLGLDIALPSSHGVTAGHIIVAPDLSGSMWQGDPSPTKKVLSELVGLCRIVNPERVDVIYWDSYVAGHEEYKRGDYEAMQNIMRPRGGGGTNPDCVEAYIKEKGLKPDCIIMLTDGDTFGHWGSNWPAPVLWIVEDNPKVTATTGKTIHM